jgi:pimeloyl-ACP methyl ester carboxylesterase
VAVRVIVFCHDQVGAAFDPDPGETIRREIELRATPPTETFSAVGWRHAGVQAAALAAATPALVDRLVLCGVPAPEDGVLTFDPGDIGAKVLLLFGQKDPVAPARDARWWKERIPGARVEMVPGAGGDIISTMWGRVLSHAAPGTIR